jgi:NADH:ubiquinone oxidoreductase subunit F (NADH-binding)
VTLGGAVTRPGVYEVAFGSRFESLIAAAGGEPAPVSAYLVGGYFGTWVRRDVIRDRLVSTTDLRSIGASLGAGVVMALPATACGITETARVMQYLADESAGQCGPCVHGLRSLSDRMHEIARTQTTPKMREDLDRWSSMIVGRGGCRLPDGAVRFLHSALIAFADELEVHQRGHCRATHREPVLPIPAAERMLTWR